MSAYVVINSDYQKKLNELYDELKINYTLDMLENDGNNNLIISSNSIVPGVFEYPNYVNLSGKTVLKMPNGTYIYKDPLDPIPWITYNYKSSYPTNYPAIVKTYDNKIIFLPHYSINGINQKLKIASHYYDKLNDWIEDDFPNVLKYLTINKNDEVELIKSLNDKGEVGNADEIKRKIKYIKTFILDEETICDIIDDFIDEKHIPLFRIYDFTYKFKEYIEEYLIDKFKRKINNQ